MLFHVRIDVHVPLDTDPQKLKDLSSREHERAKELQLQGKWTHLWRVAGNTRTSASSMSKIPLSYTMSLTHCRSIPSWKLKSPPSASTRAPWS
jgi:muconolactone delta-isomerase